MNVERKITYLEIEEVIRLVRSMPNLRDKLIILLLYETGCSVTELINILSRNIKPKTNEIIIENSVRTNEKRTVKVSKELINTIKLYILEKKKEKSVASQFLLSTRQSVSMTQKRIQQIVSVYRIKSGALSGERITPQILRYTHIAHAYEKEVGINEITRQVGLKRSRAIEIFSQLKSETRNYGRFFEKNPLGKNIMTEGAAVKKSSARNKIILKNE